jgi:hypothetical protein
MTQHSWAMQRATPMRAMPGLRSLNGAAAMGSVTPDQPEGSKAHP